MNESLLLLKVPTDVERLLLRLCSASRSLLASTGMLPMGVGLDLNRNGTANE